jgi:hypothetical protein
MKAKKNNWITIILLVLFSVIVFTVAAGFLFVSLFSRGTQVPPERIFTAFIAEPIPADVSIISGKGVSWQGFSVHLVFTCGQKTFDTLSAGYEQAVDCLDPRYHKDLSVDLRETNNDYFKEDLTQQKSLGCYVKDEREKHHTFFLYRDTASNKVFFCGYGG